MERLNDFPLTLSLKTGSGGKIVSSPGTEVLAPSADAVRKCFARSHVAAFFLGKGFTGYPVPLEAIQISCSSVAVVVCVGSRGAPPPPRRATAASSS